MLGGWPANPLSTVLIALLFQMGGQCILVTGGGGYVGSHCVLELLTAGYRVVAVDNFVNAVKDPTGETEFPESLLRVMKLSGKKLEFHCVDLLDKVGFGLLC